MMTPLQFERTNQDGVGGARNSAGCSARAAIRDNCAASPVSGARVAALYRRACEHLALARARFYPAYMVDRLERVTADAIN